MACQSVFRALFYVLGDNVDVCAFMEAIDGAIPLEIAEEKEDSDGSEV